MQIPLWVSIVFLIWAIVVTCILAKRYNIPQSPINKGYSVFCAKDHKALEILTEIVANNGVHQNKYFYTSLAVSIAFDNNTMITAPLTNLSGGSGLVFITENVPKSTNEALVKLHDAGYSSRIIGLDPDDNGSQSLAITSEALLYKWFIVFKPKQ